MTWLLLLPLFVGTDDPPVPVFTSASIVVPAAKPATVYADQAGTHRHRCNWCGTVWTHSEASYGNVAAHACPRCGVVQWQIYRGPADPTVTRRPVMAAAVCPA